MNTEQNAIREMCIRRLERVRSMVLKNETTCDDDAERKSQSLSGIDQCIGELRRMPKIKF